MVHDVQVRGGYVLHIGSVEGTIEVGDTVTMTIDEVSVINVCLGMYFLPWRVFLTLACFSYLAFYDGHLIEGGLYSRNVLAYMYNIASRTIGNDKKN